ncbi:MAG: dihydrolipoyl dehydrogenase [Planctomycetes bacterium]|nr:dihydrolipoyl dehydrogenase [Planctomycetota bacterium]MCB9825761.1 dihydrolipoyl dehydrogenase [Planctomycetota bacterium]MCB9829990.1 dihydrolipoyl dehydrogenase [Planctomycetota bacterium]
MAEDSFQLVVIGSGPGGYVAAIRAAQCGLKTAIIEEDKIGGVCLNVGCIPSKSLIYASGLVDKIRHADTMGLTVGDVSVDGKKLQEWKSAIVNRLTTGVGFLLSKNGVTTIHGHAEFASPNSLEVTDAEGAKRTVRFEKCIVATGARAATLPFLPIGGNVMTYREALDIDRVPKSFTVIGGGVIGLELGTVFQRLGAHLTVIELTDSLLPGVDPECVKVVERSIQKAGGKIHKQTGATGIETKKDGTLIVKAKDGKGKELAIESEIVLVAIGFKPNSDRVNAAKAGLAIDKTGHFTVNASRQTNVPHIYAIGDVAGLPWLAHKASKEGIVAAEHAAGEKSIYDVRAMPAAVFTYPEVGTVGLQEHEAAAQGRKVKVGKFPFTALGRALSVGASEGFVKMIADPETDELLGLAAVGYQASDLVAEAALAIEMGATTEDVALTVHAHPTWPESLMEAAEAVHKKAIHILNT